MKLTFAFDKKKKKLHYQVRHGDIDQQEFEEVFSKPIVVIGQKNPVLKAVGRTVQGRFLTVVFIRQTGDHYHIITAWPSKKRQILLWHREMKKR
jgi:uncharacterized DUF497 family protein